MDNTEFYIEKDGAFVDAVGTIGVHMGDTFLSQIDGFITPKSYVENDPRTQHGTHVTLGTVRYSSRDVTLPFVILGDDESKLRSNRQAFLEILLKGKVRIKIPVLNTIYTLYYKDSSEYGLNRHRNLCKMSVKFTEADPSSRETIVTETE